MTTCPTCADHAASYLRAVTVGQNAAAVKAKAEYENHVATEHVAELRAYFVGCVDCREWELALRRLDDAKPEVTAALSHGVALHLAEHRLRNTLRHASGLPAPETTPAPAAAS